MLLANFAQFVGSVLADLLKTVVLAVATSITTGFATIAIVIFPMAKACKIIQQNLFGENYHEVLCKDKYVSGCLKGHFTQVDSKE